MHPRHRVTRSRGKKIFGLWRSTDKNSAKEATAEIRDFPQFTSQLPGVIVTHEVIDALKDTQGCLQRALDAENC